MKTKQVDNTITPEQQLRELQFYTKSVLESNNDAVIITDPKGIIVNINHQMEKLTGYGKNELIGSHFKSYFTNPERAEDGLQLVLKETNVSGYELTAKSKTGVETMVSYNATPYYNIEGKLMGVFATARDITHRKHFEEKLQEADQIKSEFLANMSHELRTPLNAIIGFSEFMIDKKVGPLNAKQEEYMGDILKSGNHLLQLINDVLDLEKTEAGTMELVAETFSIRLAIDEVLTITNNIAKKKNIAISIDIAPEINVVTIDKHKFKQIIYKLLSNALKFTNDSGKVYIKVETEGVNNLLVIVKDTGIGISKAGINKLFAPFVQLDSGFSRQHDGTGLGLALTKKFVELHKGSISVESEVAKGSIFTVYLPINVNVVD